MVAILQVLANFVPCIRLPLRRKPKDHPGNMDQIFRVVWRWLWSVNCVITHAAPLCKTFELP